MTCLKGYYIAMFMSPSFSYICHKMRLRVRPPKILWVVPSMVGVVPSMVGVVHSMVGVIPSMVGVGT